MAKLNWNKVNSDNLGRRHGYEQLETGPFCGPIAHAQKKVKVLRPPAPPPTCMKCRKCGANTTRRTHDGPKRGKTMWYAWYFHCRACGWLFMPKEAVRHVDANIAAALPSPTQTDAYRHQDAGDDGRAPW